MYFTKTTDPYGNTRMTPRVGKIVSHIVIGLLLIIAILSSVGTVGAGQRGVKTRFGGVTGAVLGEGLYFKTPFIEKVVKIDVKTQKEQADANAASKDLQNVNTTIALNYSVRPDAAAKLYQDVGVDYKTTIIDPAIQESIKASTANFTAEELVTHREEVRDQVQAALTTRLATNGILVEQFSIVNFKFSPSFEQAIEAKVTAEQDALAAKNKLAQVQYEAQQAIEKAKGNAEALRVESAAINSNPQVLQLRAIEKWNGVLPQVTGAATPFVNLK